MSYTADEYYSVYHEEFPRARKPHRCCACKRTVSPGHRYARVSVVFEGTAETLKRCLRCQRIHEHLRTLGEWDVWPSEELDCGETYEDHWGKPPPPEIAALAFATDAELQHEDGGGK